MKERIKNEKGFTLVELLAVIVILGLLMAIAIPSVTKYITQSRKKTLISSVDSYVTVVTTAVNDNEFGAMSKEDTMYYVPVSNDESSSCVSLEKGGTNPFGNWKEAYVVVNYDADNYSYDYYFTFYDDAGYGMALTEIDKISATGNIITNPSPVNAENITLQKNDRASNIKVLVAGSCNVDSAVSGGSNNNQTNENSLANLIKKNNTIITVAPTLTTSSNNSSDASGLYKSTATNSGSPTFYFRGNVTNNYVKFAGLTWRIIRINEDGSIRLILSNTIGGTHQISSAYNDYKYMYYSNSDTAKPTVDNWYQTNIVDKGYDSYVVKTTFCEQAKVKPKSSYTSGNATMVEYTAYTPNFKCETDGNNKGVINSKVGLITYDEVIHAGGYYDKSNTSCYLSNGSYYMWTMTPAGFNSPYARTWDAGANGSVSHNIVNGGSGFRPVINLNIETQATGTGTSTDPYMVV